MQATTGRILASVAFGALALAACGGGDDSANTTTTTAPESAGPPACDELFTDGAVISNEQWAAGCTSDSGALVLAVSYGYDCGTAWSNDLGWGYGGRPFHAGASLPGLDVISVCGGE